MNSRDDAMLCHIVGLLDDAGYLPGLDPWDFSIPDQCIQFFFGRTMTIIFVSVGARSDIPRTYVIQENIVLSQGQEVEANFLGSEG